MTFEKEVPQKRLNKNIHFDQNQSQTHNFQQLTNPSNIHLPSESHRKTQNNQQNLTKKTKIILIASIIAVVLFIIGVVLYFCLFRKDPNEQFYDIVRLNSNSALCLDGSPAAYHVSRNGNRSQILIYFAGGGWCAGSNQNTTLQSCYTRSFNQIGTSTQLKQETSATRGIMSNEPSNYFRDWTRVYFHYCDGSGHQGTRKQPVLYKDRLLYFRGHNITTERFQDLEQKLGLFTKADKVVIVGESAGGLATVMWTNYLRDKVQKGKVWSIPDAGLFYDSVNIKTNTHLHKENFANLMKFSNAQIDPPVPECIAKFPESRENCMLAQNLYEHVKVPMFVTQSLYDSYSLIEIIGATCVGVSISVCSSVIRQKIQENRQNVMGLLKKVAQKKSNGVWGISCVNHMMLANFGFTSEYYKVGGYTLNGAIAEWMQNSDVNHTHLDEVSWPDNVLCS